MRIFYFAFSFLVLLCFVPENAISEAENPVPINMHFKISGKNITVSIHADSLVPQKNVNAAIKSITSETIFMQGGQVYFDGWEGALIDAARHHSSSVIPLHIQIVNSNYDSPDVVLVFVSSKSDKGYSGLTTFVTENGMIKNSHVTIYEADEMTAGQTAAVTRHEFGHALGLGHSIISSDLMYPIFTMDSAFISELDEKSIEYLYG